MYAVCAADHRRLLVLFSASLDRGRQRIDIFENQIAGIAHLQRERRVEHVRRGHAEVQPARGFADALGDRGRERDHVVLRDLFDFVNARDEVVELGFRLFAEHLRVGGRDNAVGDQRIGRRQLHVQPGLVLVSIAPDGAHFGLGITRNHRRSLPASIDAASGPTIVALS